MVDTKKYKLVKNKGGKNKVVKIYGVKKQLYVKVKTRTLYVMSKGKMMKLSKYKQMKKTANTNKKTVKRKTTNKKPIKTKNLKKKRKTKKTGGMEFQSVEEFLRYPFWDEGTVGRLYTKFGMVGIRQARFTIEEVTKQGSLNHPLALMRRKQGEALYNWLREYVTSGMAAARGEQRNAEDDMNSINNAFANMRI